MFLNILSLALISVTGVFINLYLFVSFAISKKKPFTSFHKICLSKTVPNLLISFIFAFWSVPVSSVQLSMEEIPRLENIIVSQILGGFSYPFSPLLQILMASDRLISIFFPFAKMKQYRLPLIEFAIATSAVIACGPIFVSINTGCYLVYDPKTLVFLPELEECAHAMDRLMFVTICTLSSITNLINAVILVKLLKDKMDGISDVEKKRRRKRFQMTFTQSVIQDLLQVIDITNYNFVSKIVDEPWWQFVFCCLSFAMVYVLDGAVMMYFHSDLHIRKGRKVSGTVVNVSAVFNSGQS